MLCVLPAIYFGWKEEALEYRDHGKLLSLRSYLHTGHFISATFENFQSEFLQMGLYVILSIFLRQVGSAESKKIETEEDVDREPVAAPGAPGPVKKVGWRLAIYKHSLSLAFIGLFLISLAMHLYGSLSQ